MLITIKDITLRARRVIEHFSITLILYGNEKKKIEIISTKDSIPVDYGSLWL